MNTPASLATALELPHSIPSRSPGQIARWVVHGEKLFDAVAILAALYTAESLHAVLRPRTAVWLDPSARFFCATAFVLLLIFLLDRHGGYRPCLSLLAIRETERVLRVTLESFALALVTIYLCGATVSRIILAIALFLVPLFLTLEKVQVHGLLRTLRSRGLGARRAVILGTGSAARRIYTALVSSPKLGIEPVAFVEEGATTTTTEIYECSYRRKHSAKVVPGPLGDRLYRELDVSVVVIAEPGFDREALRVVSSEAAEAGIDTYFVPGDFFDDGLWVDYAELDGMTLAHVSRGCHRALYEVSKRILDITLAVFAVIALMPLALFIAVLVKKTTAGPILFRQARVGRAGLLFTMYKFRTMFEDAPRYGYSPGQTDDPRLTPVGRFLRRTSLDEIPQLLNVLLGHMSLVGPRPEMPFLVEQYTPLQRQRLAAKPGITGLWQISADRAYLIHENIEYDLYYVRHRSLFMDVAIILHTLLFAPRGV